MLSIRKTQTCEEGGPQFRISIWHLLMNLKNNYYLKRLLKWANKKYKNFNICIVLFLKNKEKHLEISLFYTCILKILMI